MPTADDQLSRLIHELCSFLAGLLQAPHPALPLADAPPALRRRPPQRMSPAGFASLLLGASLALMLCGSVTFVIGFMLLPWVIGLVTVFYFAEILSSLSAMGRAVFCPNSCPSSPKEMSVLFAASVFHFGRMSLSKRLTLFGGLFLDLISPIGRITVF